MFVLDGLYSDSDRGNDSKYVPSDMVHVYVDESTSAVGEFSKWEIA